MPAVQEAGGRMSIRREWAELIDKRWANLFNLVDTATLDAIKAATCQLLLAVHWADCEECYNEEDCETRERIERLERG